MLPPGPFRGAAGLPAAIGPLWQSVHRDARDGERIRIRELFNRGHESAGIFGCPVGGSVAVRCRQAGSTGMLAGRAKAPELLSPRQRSGRCRVNRRAERVSRPAREKNRRRRVLVVAIRSPRPIRAVERARLWTIVWTASQAPLAAKRPEGRWFSPTPYLRSRMAFSISAGGESASSSSNSPSRSVMKP